MGRKRKWRGLKRWLREWASAVRRDYGTFGWRGVHFAIRSKMSEAPAAVKVKAPGIPRPLLIRTHTSDWHVFNELFSQRAYDLRLVNDPKVILDCGANIGLTSILFANRFPGSRIFAYEPEDANFRVCARNCAPYAQVTPVQAAVWGRNCELTVYDPGKYGSWGIRVDDNLEEGDHRGLGRIAGKTIDRIMEEQGIDYVDLLKVDIEGAEAEVFRDPSKWIDRVGVIVVECHDWFRPGCEASVAAATSAFEIEWKHGDNFVFAREGLLAAP